MIKELLRRLMSSVWEKKEVLAPQVYLFRRQEVTPSFRHIVPGWFMASWQIWVRTNALQFVLSSYS